MRRKSERATPKKAETTATPRRTRRGRGAARSPSPEEETPEESQVTTETEEQSHEEVQQQPDDSEDEVIPLPKKRGRRSTRQSSTEVETTPTTKRRGRQRRVTQVTEVIEEETPTVETIPEEQPEVTTEKEVEVVEPEVVQEEAVEQETVKEDEREQEEVEEVQEQREVEEEQPLAVDEESNAVSEVPSEPAQESPEQPPEQEEPVHNLVAEDSSKDSDIVDIQPAQDDLEQVLEPSVREDEDMSRESGEIVEEKTEEPEQPPVPETPKRPRRKFMSRFSIQATRDEQKPDSVNENLHESAAANNVAEVTKEEEPKDSSEKQHQHQPNDNDVNERVSNKKRSSRSKENDHNNLDVVTNTNNKNKSSIKSGGAEHKNEVDKELLDEHSEEKENEPSATAAISAAPLPAGQRKRKWITQKSVDNKPAIISISTDSLKELIPEVVPVPIKDVQMDVSPEAGEILDDANTDKENDQVVRKRRVSEKSVENSEKVNKKRKPENDSHEKMHGSTKDTLNHKDKVPLPPSPPKQTQSNILYITNLVRPFTVLQLKGLLARTGKIVENGFWIDKIKSKCYVQYETEDEAVETRHALHGVRWPTSNPKCLNVDFGRDKDMEKAIVSTLEDNSRSLGTTDAASKESSGGFGWSKADAFRVEVENQKSSWDKDRPVREWDLGKKDELLNENEERHGRDERRRGDRGDRKRSQEPGDRRRSRSTSAGRRKERKTENDPPIRLLDDLFRKTKATPCIYWLPLTSEQIAEREEIRRKRLEEQDRQLKEMQKAREERMKERERLRQERQRSRSRENKDRVEKRRRSRSRSRSRSRDRRRYNR